MMEVNPTLLSILNIVEDIENDTLDRLMNGRGTDGDQFVVQRAIHDIRKRVAEVAEIVRHPEDYETENKQTVPFSDIAEGDRFLYKGKIYVKLDGSMGSEPGLFTRFAAIRLETFDEVYPLPRRD